MTGSLKLTYRELLIQLLKDPDRKPLIKIVTEFFYLFFIYKELPKHYFSRYLFKKGIHNIRDFLPNKFLDEKIFSRFSDIKVKEVLDNKLYFYLFYRQFNLSIAQVLMFNHRSMFIAAGKSTEIRTLNDFTLLLEGIFKNNPSFESIMVKKTYSSSSGRHVYKIFRNQLKTDPETIGKLFNEVIQTSYIFQETLSQHAELSKLNPSCINTIRMDTFIDGEGNGNVISAYIRMSTSNSHVDNFNEGGCAVGISLETGRLKKYGYSSFKNVGVKVLTQHPITKTIFENFNIPFLPQAKELVLKAARLVPELRLIGWDVAIGESGPVLIEGNSNYQISGSDFLYGGYRANNSFRKVLNEFNNS
jgi:hypothetical protein